MLLRPPHDSNVAINMLMSSVTLAIRQQNGGNRNLKTSGTIFAMMAM
ncbi:hypothetical protein EC182770_3572 [Escherichia coli 1827-70]|nr:hypothetical protein EC182770_3572 [Escherichia coli 1827-70]